ncbi:hypothetical protein IP86_15630 [Rhodopseudomonas sp. AAP120]|nr:hypothetical protein IP86_15630 [Rhodopseudomonas sp. AAP120]
MVRRREAPSRTMGHWCCVAPSFETPGFAGLLRMRTQCKMARAALLQLVDRRASRKSTLSFDEHSKTWMPRDKRGHDEQQGLRVSC